MTFDKQSLLKTFAPRINAIHIDVEGGGTMDLFAKELSARQVFDLQAFQKKNGADSEQFVVMLLSLGLCDEKGKSILTETEIKELIAGMRIGPFTELSTKVAEAVGLNIAKAKDAKEGEARPNA